MIKIQTFLIKNHISRGNITNLSNQKPSEIVVLWSN